MKFKSLDTHTAYGGDGPIALALIWLGNFIQSAKCDGAAEVRGTALENARYALADARKLLESEVPEPVAAVADALKAAAIAGYVDMTPAAVILDLHTQLTARSADKAPGLGVAIKWHEERAQHYRDEAAKYPGSQGLERSLKAQAHKHDVYSVCLRNLLTEPELIA